METVADSAAVLDQATVADSIVNGCGDSYTLAAVRRFRDHVDHSINGVGAPECTPWTTNHFNPVDIFQGNVLQVPENTAKRWTVNAASINQHQHLAIVDPGEAARTDLP